MSTFNTYFKAPGKEKTTELLAKHLYDGRAWDKKNDIDSIIYKLTRSLSAGYEQIREQVEIYASEMYVPQALELLPEWEESVGLPDECMGEATTLDERRNAVIERLRKIPIVTLQEMQDYIDGLIEGIEIELIPGTDLFAFERTFEAPFLGAVNEKFILVVNVITSQNAFESDFEHGFGGIDTDKIECALNKIIPANVLLLFNFSTPLPVPFTALEGGDGSILVGGDGTFLAGGDS
jgi:uncharacterized protein YmfQ (DUF2313 family)